MNTHDQVDAEEFFTQAMQPEFSDRMVFQISKENPDGGTFSPEALEGIVRQMYRYILARTLAQWRATGEPPQELSVGLGLQWKRVTEPWEPWYDLRDEGKGMPIIDGSHRSANLPEDFFEE